MLDPLQNPHLCKVRLLAQHRVSSVRKSQLFSSLLHTPLFSRIDKAGVAVLTKKKERQGGRDKTEGVLAKVMGW